MMNLENLDKILRDEPKFRLIEAKRDVFVNLIETWNEAKFIPAPLREKLGKEFPLEINGQIFRSKDGKTVKALIFLDDGERIESVLMMAPKRATICVSSQVGCPMGCKFCATGKLGFTRNLTSGEIIAQILFFARFLKSDETGRKITNVVFMGMGEPFLNYDNVITAIKILNDKNGLNIGARHISISTSGVIPGIKKLQEENLQVNLAISLHAPLNKLRSSLMPINDRYPLEDLMAAVKEYVEATNRKVMFEYLLIDGINDTEECARALAGLMRNPLYMVNLIPYNSTGGFRESPPQTIKKFKESLENQGVNVTQRFRFGRDIDAACGQLAAKNKK